MSEVDKLKESLKFLRRDGHKLAEVCEIIVEGIVQLTRIADALESKTCKDCCGEARRRINRGGK